MTTKYDMSRIRPLDLEAVKRGEPVCSTHDPEPSDEAFVFKNGSVYVSWPSCGVISYDPDEFDELFMAPLCWVNKSKTDNTKIPVYKGDVLYWDSCCGPKTHVAERVDGCQVWQDSGFGVGYLLIGSLWSELATQPPKPVIKVGWVNVYGYENGEYAFKVHKTEEEATAGATLIDGTISRNREACIRIEWEVPAKASTN